MFIYEYNGTVELQFLIDPKKTLIALNSHRRIAMG